jgi:hypothetical protein
MLLKDCRSTFSLTVTGWQFPDDPLFRHNWLWIAGEATSYDEFWTFASPALTCRETPLVAAWLRAVADWADNERAVTPPPDGLYFTDPNLHFHASNAGRTGTVMVTVGLDLDFKPPRLRVYYAGQPHLLTVAVTADQLRRAAEDWDRERAPYPDGILTAAEQAERTIQTKAELQRRIARRRQKSSGNP